MNKPLEPKKAGRPALPPELKRNARLSMRTYQDVADKAARLGTEAVEALIRRAKEPSALQDLGATLKAAVDGFTPISDLVQLPDGTVMHKDDVPAA